jgi:hypothetical protein
MVTKMKTCCLIINNVKALQHIQGTCGENHQRNRRRYVHDPLDVQHTCPNAPVSPSAMSNNPISWHI